MALNATGGASGNPIVFTSNSPSVCTVSGSTATIVGAGICSITANQAGNANYAAAAPVTQTFKVNQAATTTLISSSANSSLLGQSVTFTASVSPAAAPGSVTFKDGATALCSNVPLTSGIATCTVSFATAGAHAITAIYNGSTNYAGSTSSVFTVTVIDQRPKTVEVIGKFLSRRTDMVMSNGPDSNRQIDRLLEAGAGKPGASAGSGFAGTGAAAPLNGTQGPTARLGDGPDAGDLTRMRFGLRDRPIAASRDDNPFPTPLGLGGNDRDTAPGGGAVTTGPLRLQGNTDGAMRFGFSTSLRDVARYAVEREAARDW